MCCRWCPDQAARYVWRLPRPYGRPELLPLCRDCAAELAPYVVLVPIEAALRRSELAGPHNAGELHNRPSLPREGEQIAR